MSKHFLYLTNDRMIALVWQRGAIISREAFLSTGANSPSAESYLAQHKKMPTYVVSDLVEEDFRLDTVPHLSRSDAAVVMNRKLGQLYRASPLRHAILQGRETEGRRDDRVLYHAIANADLIKPWLALLERNEVPVEGIYSSPVLSGSLLKTLDIAFPHTLLVTVVPDFGLRQTYFQDRKVKFSRITPIVYDEGQSVGALIAAETNRTWQYLDSLRNFTAGETLEVCILTHERDRAMIADAVRSYPLRTYRFLDIADVAKKIGLKSVPQSSHAEQVLVHSYAQTTLENHFAEPATRRFATFRRARMGLVGVTVAALMLGVAGTIFNTHQANQIGAQIEQRDRLIRATETEYQNISASMRAQKLTSDVVRDASAFYSRSMRTSAVAPGAMLRGVSQVFSEFPRVRLLQIVWGANDDENFTPPYAAMPLHGALEVTSQSKSATENLAQTSANTSNDVANPGIDNNPVWRGAKFQSVIIDAAVSPFDGNFRNALAEVERFAARLNTLPGLRATVLRRPLDVQSTASISATGKRSGTDPETRFVVRVMQRVGGT